MSSSNNDAAANSGALGERLLRLLSWPKLTTHSANQKTGNHQAGNPKPIVAKLLALGVENSLGQLMLVAILAALSGTGVLLLLNAEAREVEYHGYSALFALLFAFLLVIYRFLQIRLIRSATAEIEAALDRKRRKASADILDLTLRDLEDIGGHAVREGMATHYSTLSQALVPIINSVEALILFLFMFAYLLYLSVFAGVVTMIVVGLSVISYLNRCKLMEEELAAASLSDARYRRLAEATVLGDKELQMNQRRREDFKVDLDDTSSSIAKTRGNSAAHVADMIANGSTVSYLMAGAVVFVMPILTDTDQSDISRIVIAVIFLLGPIGSIVQMLQQFSMAQFALSSIEAFGERVAGARERARYMEGAGETLFQAEAFTGLSLDGVGYTHGGSHGFAIKDITLTLGKGEVVFLTGGNGSGKTTLLRVLTGLYPRADGDLFLNRTPVSKTPPQSFRELFATVFTDFHLFDRPYGLGEDGLARLDRWLTTLEVRAKLPEDLRSLDAEQLSTGQRKRVALALALAENRPVLVLDEWAADQDPSTRKRFYEEFLPGFKAEGMTIFAITHDEQYFHCCDRRLHMVEGRLVESKGA